MKRLLILACAFASLSLGGCALVAPPYQASIENAKTLKRAGAPQMNVGQVDSDASIKAISLRGSKMKPSLGNYGQYIAEAITSELKLASLYEPMSSTVISGKLLTQDINITSFMTGSSDISVTFMVSRDDSKVFKKIYTQTHEFESSFLGAIAIPNGQLAYKDLVQKLLKQVFTDPEFVAAVKG